MKNVQYSMMESNCLLILLGIYPKIINFLELPKMYYFRLSKGTYLLASW